MDQKTFLTIFAGILGVLVILGLVFESGVLPLALLLGSIAFGVTLLVSREWKISAIVGGGTAAVVSIFGVWAMLSPGWYQNLL